MQNKIKKILAISGGFIITLLQSSIAFAAFDHDITINDNSVRFSTNSFMESKKIRIYATVSNPSEFDLLGTVKFIDNENQIGGDQAISILSKKTDDVFIDWIPAYGSHHIVVKILPWEKNGDDPSNNDTEKNIYVEQDTDHDGIPNNIDPDDDNDGVPDEKDLFPLNSNESADTDGDGIGNNADPDDDNDGHLDTEDALPLDPKEWQDTDHDEIGDSIDTDDDNDGLTDEQETQLGTDSKKADTDSDGVNDKNDPFPLDSKEWADTDSDDIGNNKDIDKDNDGILDVNDKFPLNKAPTLNLDEISTASLNQETPLDASTSYDKDGNIVKYSWLIDGKYKAAGAIVNYKFTSLGEHTVKVTITDNNGESVSKEFQVSVLNVRYYSQILVLLIVLILGGIITYKYLADKKLSNLKTLLARRKENSQQKLQ